MVTIILKGGNPLNYHCSRTYFESLVAKISKDLRNIEDGLDERQIESIPISNLLASPDE